MRVLQLFESAVEEQPKLSELVVRADEAAATAEHPEKKKPQANGNVDDDCFLALFFALLQADYIFGALLFAFCQN